jgi:arylsulfatase A-like enzyme
MTRRGWMLAAVAALCCSSIMADAQVLPYPPPAFKGKAVPSREQSVPDWPQAVRPKPGAPNIVLVLLDDVGFGASSAVGGAVPTPYLDQLAAGGLRYNNFHVNAMCSPTRAALLTGRNNHQVGFGQIAESASGYSGYNSLWPRSAASIAEVLRQNGYSTAAFGKWHNTPVWEVSPAGPFDHWPTSLGFEYFYGFLGAATNQFEPSLYRNTVAVEPPATPAQGYHLSTDLANEAIKWLHQHDAVVPDKPFFLYFATGATHSPHHVPQQWIERFKGQFDQGWDQLRAQVYEREKRTGSIPGNAGLSARPKEIPAWDSLTADQKKLVARQMEIYAGFLAQTDYEVGRVIDAIKEEGHLENTLVLYIVGDNGATMEGNLYGTDRRTPQGAPESPESQVTRVEQLGSPALSNIYAAGWAWALNTPFPWAKQRASHLGGITDTLVVSWPDKIHDKGAVRGQFTHIIDVAPTIYQLTGITAPESVNGVHQSRLEGQSFAPTFDHANAVSTHTVQYFELIGNRGIYDHGWFAGRPFLLPWEGSRYETADPDQNPWELYNLNSDYSQTHDLAAENPGKLRELVALFDKEARRNDVYPIAPHRPSVPSPADGRTHFEYRTGVTRLPPRSVPQVGARSHTFKASIEVPVGGVEGVIFAEGGRYGGFSLYVQYGHLIYENNSLGSVHEKIIAADALPVGHVDVQVQFTPVRAPASGAAAAIGTTSKRPPPQASPGHAVLSVNGKVVGSADLAWFGNFGETFDVGSDLGSPVSDTYSTPFNFTGTLDKVTLDLL